jgi:hypothetical protein
MSKNKSGPVTKLREKSKALGMRRALGSQRGLTVRITASYHEKAQAFEEHKRLIHGYRHGNFVMQGGRNERAVECFRGDGFPDDSIQADTTPKAPKEDKRLPLPIKAGFKFMTVAQRRGL